LLLTESGELSMPSFDPRSVGAHKPHSTHARLALLLCALLIAVGTADAQSSRPSRQYLRSSLKVWSTIADLKEIAPGVGWVMLDAHLLWTDRDGAVWWDITPPRPATGDLSTVYALDSRHLWAAALDTPRYSLEVPFTMSLFRTSNGGHTWSNLRFEATLFPGSRRQMPIHFSCCLSIQATGGFCGSFLVARSQAPESYSRHRTGDARGQSSHVHRQPTESPLIRREMAGRQASPMKVSSG